MIEYAEPQFFGLQRLLATALSIPSRDYALLLLLVGIVWFYQAFEFHFVGDALNAWRGEVVRLVHCPRSSVPVQLLLKCGTLKKRYFSTPWLASPHLQTLFLHFVGLSPTVEYQRELYVTPDGGTIALDWVHPTSGTTVNGPRDLSQDSVLDGIPTVILIPGLTSDSSSHYVKHIVRSLSEQCWRVVVINHRGLGGVSITSDHFYNAGWTEDLRRLVPYVQQKYPNSPLLIVGTSIGANILIKYLGEEGTKVPIGGAVAICCPWDLVVCDRFIRRKWVQHLYNKALATGLCEYAQLHQATLSRIMDWSLLSSSKTVRDFDDYCTRHVGKYETVDTYYRRSGSAQFLENVAVPLLCVSAEDDPICTKEAIPYDECRINPNVILAVTKHGGHLGFFEGWSGKSLWYAGALSEFFKVLLSSSSLHQQNKGVSPAAVRIGSEIDREPFLAVIDKTGGVVGGAGFSKTVERKSGGLEMRPEAAVHHLTRPRLIKGESGKLASEELSHDQSNIPLSDDCGGPLYKSLEEESIEGSKEREPEGNANMKLQIRSLAEVMAVQSFLSQLLQQLPHHSLTSEGGLQHVSHENSSFSGVGSDCSSPRPRAGQVIQENKETVPGKVASKKTSRHGEEANRFRHSTAGKKDAASHLMSQNRRTFWLLAYIALITTFPLLGSALIVKTRGRLLRMLSRQWTKYKR